MPAEVLPMNTVGLPYSSPGDILSHYMDREIVSVPFMAATVDSNVYIAVRPVRVTAVRGVNTVVGGSGATATIKKCTGTTAPASGTAVHSTPIDGTATVNTVQSATLATSVATLTLAAGDRLSIDVGGTLTSLVALIQIELQPL